MRLLRHRNLIIKKDIRFQYLSKAFFLKGTFGFSCFSYMGLLFPCYVKRRQMGAPERIHRLN